MVKMNQIKGNYTKNKIWIHGINFLNKFTLLKRNLSSKWIKH